jgi:hypothetical protein
MVHGNTVANRYGLKFKGSSASQAHPGFYCLPYFVEIDMTGHDIIEGIYYTYKWPGDFLVGETQSPKK